MNLVFVPVYVFVFLHLEQDIVNKILYDINNISQFNELNHALKDK